MGDNSTKSEPEKVHHYWWRFFSVYGEECYKTWRQELLASVIAACATFFITWANDKLAWSTLRTALGATAITLAAFAIWHLVKIPYLLTRARKEPHKLAGYFGVFIVLCLMGGAAPIAIVVRSHWNPTTASILAENRPPVLPPQFPTTKSNPSPTGLIPHPDTKENMKKEQPRRSGITLGKDSVAMGHIPDGSQIGDGSVVVGPTDTNGNTIIPRGTAVGHGATTDSSGVALGAGAGEKQVTPPKQQHCETGSICNQDSDVNAPQTIHNKYGEPLPPPRIAWLSQSDIAPNTTTFNYQIEGSYGRNPGKSLNFIVESDFPNPIFRVTCDRACVATDISINGQFRVQHWDDPDDIKSSFIRLITAGGLLARQQATVKVRSRDEQNINKLSISPYVEPIKQP